MSLTSTTGLDNALPGAYRACVEAQGGADSVPVLRPARDRERPSVDTAEAAKRLGLRRYSVARRIQQGTLAGYGVPGPERVRWYAYEDALPPPPPARAAAGDDMALAAVLAEALSIRARQEAEEAEDDAAVLLARERQERARARRLLAQADLERDAERVARARASDALAEADAAAARAATAEKEARLADALADEAAAAADTGLQKANRLLRRSLVRADDEISRAFLGQQTPQRAVGTGA